MRSQFDDPGQYKDVSSARDGAGAVDEVVLHVHDKQRGISGAETLARAFVVVMIVAVLNDESRG